MPAVLYEISNPSDPYTMIASELRFAAAAVLILGEGKMGAHPVDDDAAESVPIFLLGGHEPWLAAHGIKDLAAFIMANPSPIAEVLESVQIGKPSDRRAMEAVFAAIADPKDRTAAQAAYHDQKRSSLNDIGGRASHYAKTLRALAARGPTTQPTETPP